MLQHLELTLSLRQISSREIVALHGSQSFHFYETDTVVKAIIFDLYDTLIHLPRNVNPYIELYRLVDCQDRIRESMVIDSPTLLDYCDYLGVEPPSNIAQLQSELDADIASAKLFEDTLPALKTAREQGMRIGVISNVATPYILPFYRLGLNHFVEVQVFSCKIGVAKPDARIYQAAIDSLGVDAQKTIMIGDSKRSDVDGPSACGIRGILLDRNRTDSNDTILHTLNDLAEYL